MDDELFNLINGIIKDNGSIVTNTEPPLLKPDDALVSIFQKEQRAKRIYQPILIVGLIAFLFVQLINMNKLYSGSIDTLLNLKDVNVELAEHYFRLYDEILKHLKFYTTAVLCEFIAMLYFIIRWGFNTSISDMFSDFFEKGKRAKK